MEYYEDVTEPQTVIQKAGAVIDSAVSYCGGVGLAWASCEAQQLTPILQAIGIFVGIGLALLKGYCDWRKYKKSSFFGKPVNDR